MVDGVYLSPTALFAAAETGAAMAIIRFGRWTG